MIVTLSVQSQKSDPLPDGYKNVDVGEPDLISKTIYNAEEDKYFLSGGGINTWGTEDELNFVYFETEEDKEVVVRIIDFDFSQAVWNSKGFIMIRSSLEPEASMCFLELRRDGCVFLSGRREVAGSSSIFGQQCGVSPIYPRWIKFVRQGKYITGYHKDTTEDAQWDRIATVELALKGKAYLGIGVCGGGNGAGYIKGEFDQLEVRDIEIPYEVAEEVTPQKVNVGSTKKVNVTHTFGHYIGDYWTIDAVSSDENIATVSFSETFNANPADGEEYTKYINIEGHKDGVVAVKLLTNIKGFRMSTYFVTEVHGSNPVNDQVNDMSPPNPWLFNELLSKYPKLINFNSNPYTTLNIPATINAENFDNGGEGIAFHDSDTLNSGGQYRTGIGVDIEVDTSGDYYVSSDTAGEWMNFTMYAQETGTYQLDIRTSAPATTVAKFHVEIDGEPVFDSVEVPLSEGLYDWKTITFEGIHLKKGKHLLKYIVDRVDSIEFNLNDFTFSLEESLYENSTSWMEYTGDISNEVKVLTNLSDIDGLEDNLSYLYQEFDNTDSAEITVFIDSVKNTGTGSFAGLMIRQSFDTITGTSPFVALSAGAYQGLKFSYRWDETVSVGSLDDDRITPPCWLSLIKYNDNGADFVEAFYSLDGNEWKSYLKYPFNTPFFNNKIVGGLAVCGGNYVSDTRSALAVVKNLEVKINQPFSPLLTSVNKVLSKNQLLKISPNPITGSAKITYHVSRPGKVTLMIYDVRGMLRDILINDHHMAGDYSISYHPEGLINNNIYLLRMKTGSINQYFKFIYFK